MEPARLVAWERLERRRRRGFPLAVSAAAVVLAALVGWFVVDHRAAAASGWWLAAAVVSAAIGVLAAPFLMYWQDDAPLWARLPIGGDALLAAAWARSRRAALAVVMVLAPAALVSAIGSVDLALRQLAATATLAVVTAGLAPAAALAGGAIVASARVDAMVSSLAGTQLKPPAIGWIGGLVALVASATILLLLALASWLGGGTTGLLGGWGALGGAVGVTVIAAWWARGAASRHLASALREITALDRQQLAHLDLHPPTATERLWLRLFPRDAALVLAKDVRLARRHYPLAYALGVSVVLAQVIVAAAGADRWREWAVGSAAALVVTALLIGQKLWRVPLEHRRLLATLPIGEAAVSSAKRGWVAGWLVVYGGLAAVPMVVRLLSDR